MPADAPSACSRHSVSAPICGAPHRGVTSTDRPRPGSPPGVSRAHTPTPRSWYPDPVCSASTRPDASTSTRPAPSAARKPPATSSPVPVAPAPPSYRPLTAANGRTVSPVPNVRPISRPSRDWCTATRRPASSPTPPASPSVSSHTPPTSPRSASSSPPSGPSSRRTPPSPISAARSADSAAAVTDRSSAARPQPAPNTPHTDVRSSSAHRAYGCAVTSRVDTSPCPLTPAAASWNA